MIIKGNKKLPRLLTIPGLSKEDYRKLQNGKAVEVSEETGNYLILHGFAVTEEATNA